MLYNKVGTQTKPSLQIPKNMTSTKITDSTSNQASLQFSKLLRQLRLRRNLTLRELAAKIGAHASNLSLVESGRLQLTEEHVRKLVSVLQLRGQEKSDFEVKAMQARKPIFG